MLELDRNEIALRFAVAAYGGCFANSKEPLPADDNTLIDDAFGMADAFLRGMERRASKIPDIAARAEPRPEWVRITGPKNAVRVTVGKAYRVVGWHNAHGGGPIIECDESKASWHCYPPDRATSVFPSWEPCAAPDAYPATEQRRTVGAVVLDPDRNEWIVVGDGWARNVQRDLNAIRFRLRDTEVFVRWATRVECARHGIPFVDRTAPAATPAAYSPKVGDKVEFDVAFYDYKLGVIVAVDEAQQVVTIVRLGEVPSKPKWKRHYRDLRFIGVANDIERVNAGLPVPPVECEATGQQPATPTVDRVALAKAIRSAQVDSDGSGWSQRSPWDRLGDGDIKAYLAAADAAIAYFAARGVKS